MYFDQFSITFQYRHLNIVGAIACTVSTANGISHGSRGTGQEVVFFLSICQKEKQLRNSSYKGLW